MNTHARLRTTCRSLTSENLLQLEARQPGKCSSEGPSDPVGWHRGAGVKAEAHGHVPAQRPLTLVGRMVGTPLGAILMTQESWTSEVGTLGSPVKQRKTIYSCQRGAVGRPGETPAGWRSGPGSALTPGGL